MTWFVTTAMQGGQFAIRAESSVDAYKPLMAAMGGNAVDCSYRPASPDLAEWLDTPVETWVDRGGFSYRKREPGGWLYGESKQEMRPDGRWSDAYTVAMCFIPVAGAAGITVLP